nr:class I SAM-dependent methyltransferase [uncultured Methanoregula sp.]
MQDRLTEIQSHYDRFLAEPYLWMAGGFDANIQRNRDFFSGKDLVPHGSRAAVDLGAGCGFQSIPLARAGFSVAAVDFCRPLLAELEDRAGTSPVETIQSDILNFPAWAKKSPELIVCMGDTLTHLRDLDDVRCLIRQCHVELEPKGILVLSLRDYSYEPEGSVVVIPVRRDAQRIFLCRLEYARESVHVTDIIFSRESGRWERIASTYRKCRIAREVLACILSDAGFRIGLSETANGIITMIAKKT